MHVPKHCSPYENVMDKQKPDVYIYPVVLFSQPQVNAKTAVSRRPSGVECKYTINMTNNEGTRPQYQ